MSKQNKDSLDHLFKIDTSKMEEARRRSIGATRAKEKREREGDPFVKDMIKEKRNAK